MGSCLRFGKRMFRLFAAFLLGPATCLLIEYASSRSPYSEQRDYVRDAFSLPGGLIAAIFYPQGIHSGGGAIGFAYVAWAANWIFYGAIWYFLLGGLARLWSWRKGSN